MTGINAGRLTDRLGVQREDYWLHLQSETPFEKYPAKQHARRVVEKLGVSNGLIYLPGAVSRNNEDSDMPAPFRQRRYFYYISGCNEPNCHVIYDIQNDHLTLFIPRIDPARVIWNGRGSTPQEALDKYDIDCVFFTDQTQDIITKWLNHYKGNLYILRPEQSPLAKATRELDSTSLRPAMDMARVVKSEHEIKLIRKANDISSQAHRAVLANILRFSNEAQVEGLFVDVCISNKAKQQAYNPIAASGPNAGTLHYDANDEDFGNRQLMCLDAGCEFELYASDITRTFPLSGNWPTKEAENIYRLVERMQEACIDRMGPGVRFLDLHVLAHQIAIDGLLDLGILHNGTREEIFKAGTSKAFFPHGLGHHVGLEVHDVGHAELVSANEEGSQQQAVASIYPENFYLPVYDASVCRAPVHPQAGHMEEGMVITVEPGIYFSLYALKMFYLPNPIHAQFINVDVLKKYFPVGGVRIEDDILITGKGYENLTTAPKGDAMLQIIRSRKANATVSPRLGMSSQGTNNGEKAKEKEEPPMVRAPGVPKHMRDPVPAPAPVKRVSTLPAKLPTMPDPLRSITQSRSPSLFANFQNALGAASKPGPKTSPALANNNPYASAITPQPRTVQISTPTQKTPICQSKLAAYSHVYDIVATPRGEVKTSTLHEPNKAPCPECQKRVQAYSGQISAQCRAINEAYAGYQSVSTEKCACGSELFSSPAAQLKQTAFCMYGSHDSTSQAKGSFTTAHSIKTAPEPPRISAYSTAAARSEKPLSSVIRNVERAPASQLQRMQQVQMPKQVGFGNSQMDWGPRRTTEANGAPSPTNLQRETKEELHQWDRDAGNPNVAALPRPTGSSNDGVASPSVVLAYRPKVVSSTSPTAQRQPDTSVPSQSVRLRQSMPVLSVGGLAGRDQAARNSVFAVSPAAFKDRTQGNAPYQTWFPK